MRNGLLIMLVTLCVAGCGGGMGVERMQVAAVKGTVTMDGQPVTSGRIFFYPVANAATTNTGKPAQGVLASDGSFQLSTYGSADGAVVGTHQVTVMESEALAGSDDDTRQVGYLNGTITVTANKTNVVNIELTAPKEKRKRS